MSETKSKERQGESSEGRREHIFRISERRSRTRTQVRDGAVRLKGLPKPVETGVR